MGQIGTEAFTNVDDTHGNSHFPGTDTPSTYARRTPYALAVAVISILVVSLATIALWQEKQRYRERATVATQNISRLTMVVEDSGNGVPVRDEVLVATKGFGLTNVRERIAFLGGKMTIETPAGGGLRVVLQMPLVAGTRAPEVPA